MPHRPAPARGDAPFPSSRGWSGASWAHVIDHHVQGHGRSDFFVGFDDQDRICAVCTGEKGYAVRIPLPLVDWTEKEMVAANVTPRPNHPSQFRLERGDGNSRLSEDPVPTQGDLQAMIADRCGIDITHTAGHFQGDILSIQVNGEGPIIIRGTDYGRHVLGWMERDRNDWVIRYGVADPREPRQLEISQSAGDVRQVRGGRALDILVEKIEERVAADNELAAHMQGMRQEHLPDGP